MSSEGRRGVCLVVSAPSGAGKSSALRGLLAEEPGLALSVSATTRAPRPGERDGWITCSRTGPGSMPWRRGRVAGVATVFGRSYGTPRAPVEAALAAGRDIAFDIDWQGHRLVRAALPGDVVSVFLLPPSMAALRERLESRGTDAEAEIGRRMEAAQSELSHWAEFDHVVVNERLATTVEAMRERVERGPVCATAAAWVGGVRGGAGELGLAAQFGGWGVAGRAAVGVTRTPMVPTEISGGARNSSIASTTPSRLASSAFSTTVRRT